MRDVIIACDFSSEVELFSFLDKFGECKPFLKIGMELYYKEGPNLVSKLKALGYRIFLDLKLHDIPTTVYKAMKNIASLGVDMLNCHAGGGIEMMQAALKGVIDGSKDKLRPTLIAVTQLTSTSPEILKNDLLISSSLEDTVRAYAQNAKTAGLDGVVCSPNEAPIMKELGLISVTPGIRLATGDKHDQKRIATPSFARELGSDYIVVGRPITAAPEPVVAYLSIRDEFLAEQSPKPIKVELQPPQISGIYYPNLAKKIAENLLKIKAVFVRPSEPFTWASGIKSPIYCDNRMTMAYPEIRKLIAMGMSQIIKNLFPTCSIIMGAATGGIPHATLVAQLLDLPLGYVRADAKKHGRTNQIEGATVVNQDVVIIEDLISTAGSSIDVATALRQAGANVLAIVSIFTYNLQKGLDRLGSEDILNISLSDINTLVDVAVDHNYITPNERKMTLQFIADPDNPQWQII
jgi:orotidine 5'-phosphate decarboxylase subfamily 1/orotate phosphoribosyltransferase